MFLSNTTGKENAIQGNSRNGIVDSSGLRRNAQHVEGSLAAYMPVRLVGLK